jgi:hypothetical protein
LGDTLNSPPIFQFPALKNFRGEDEATIGTSHQQQVMLQTKRIGNGRVLSAFFFAPRCRFLSFIRLHRSMVLFSLATSATGIINNPKVKRDA